MAHPLRLLGRMAGGGGRRGRLPPPLAALAHLSASPHRSPDRQLPSPAPPLPSRPRFLPFAVPARSFSWYSRSPSVPAAGAVAAEAPVGEGAGVETKGIYLDDASTIDYGEVLPGAAGGAADAAAGVAVGSDGSGISGFCMGTVVDAIDGFHSLTGLPWWITISVSTVAMRLVILPALVLQLHKTAKIGQLFRKLPPPFPPPLSGRSYRDQYSLFQKKRRELGCPSFLWNFAYFSVQLPCFILWMASIRSMCLSNHPGLDNGGILWFHDLTEFPHGALGPVFPILVAGLHYLNIQISFQKSHTKELPGVLGVLAKYYKIYLDILSIPLLLIAYVVPQGSLIYWTTNGLFSVAQQLSLRNDVIRKMLGLPDIGAHSGNASPKSVLEGQKAMQQWPLGGTPVQSKLGSSDNETPKFMFENSTIMEENVSESSSPEELLQQALQYLQTGCQDQAIPLIKTAIEKNPDLFDCLIGMGQMLFQNKLFAESAVCYDHAIPMIKEQDPLLILAYFGAGLSRQQQGDNETAIKLLQRIAELKEPEKNKQCYFQGFIVLASILLNEGRNSEAAKYLRLAMAYDPTAERLLKECEDSMEDQPSQQNIEPPDQKSQ
ncbi:ALBINO3-like protein 2, chloroplastic [Lolium rigidum]|uniref:ALBINO3-like protein 2, chloroplastic n=1 Tax=Lolium rigidum TaxID=89674 RepID=UPI001F5CEA96|nr:ALBINO3-like protein 2, chloroplastic [Lolium rigidum]